MAAPSTLAQAKSMSQAALNKLSKAQIMDLLLDGMKNMDKTDASLQSQIVIDKIDELRDEIRGYVARQEKLEARVDSLETTVQSQSNIMYSQQLFIEQLDAKNRVNRLIITGVPEDVDFEHAKTDDDKVKYIFDKLEIPDLVYSVERIGKPNDATSTPGRIRAILLTVDDDTDRKKLLAATDKLKKIKPLKRVFIKKDKHPAVRREWGRLFKAEQEEKNKPENRHSQIVFDKKTRKLLKDDVVIDSWKPSYF